MQARGWPGDELPHRTVLAAMAGEPYPRAQVAVPMTALAAGFARDGRIDRDPLSLVRASLHNPGGFVPENQGLIQLGIADARLAPPVQIRTADPDCRDTDEAAARLRLRWGFVCHPQISGRVQ